MYYFTPNTISELICFLVALVCLRRDALLMWRIMVVYLFVTCLAEFGGAYIAGPNNSINNQWLYNIYLIFEMGFTHLMFAFLMSKYINARPIILIGLSIVGLIFIYETVEHGVFNYNFKTYTLMSVLFVVYSLFYFFLLLKDPKYLKLVVLPEFWWTMGTLFFYFGDTTSNLFYKQLSTVIFKNGHHLTYYIFIALNIILYSCWSYSFICRKWLMKRSEI